MKLCKLWLQHWDTNSGRSTLKPCSFSTLANYINKFDFVKTFSLTEYNSYLNDEEDAFGNSPYFEEYLDDFRDSSSVVVYGEDGGTSFDSIVQFNF